MAYLNTLRSLSAFLQDKLYAWASFAAGGLYSDGSLAKGVLFMSGDVIADETVTIGTTVFQAKAITTDSGATATLATAAAGAVSRLTLNQASGTLTTCGVGDLVRLENEICKIVSVLIAGTDFTVARGRCGTTIAAHAAVSVYQASAVSATNVPVGVNATLTPVVFLAALVAEINNALANGQRLVTKASALFDPGATFADGVARADSARAGKIVALAQGTDTMIIKSAIPENSVLATTETLTNGAWNQGATMLYGAALSAKRIRVFSQVPTAADVTQGSLFFPVNFTPRSMSVNVRVTSSGLAKAWVGAVNYAAGIITVDNSGAVDWAATDTVQVIAHE